MSSVATIAASDPVSNTSPHDFASDWTAFRSAFPTTERFVYLDTARKALVPRWVEQAMQSWVRDVYDNAGTAAFSMEMVEAARHDIAETFGAPANNIALIKNTSEGMNIIAQGLQIAPGENVVLSEFEHENNTFPWRYLARKGIETRIIPAAEDGRIPLDRYRAAIDGKTRVVTVAWVAYGNGLRADVPAIAAIAHEHGAFVVVDGIQGIGLLDQRIDALGSDAVVSGGHKAMMSLAGAGFLYVDDSALERVLPPYAAKFSFTSLDRNVPELELAPDAHRFEYGNPNFIGIWVQQHSARAIRRVGLDRIESRIRQLTDRMIAGLDARGIRVRTPRPWNERAGIISMDTGKSARETVALLAARRIVVSEKDGFVRVSLHAYNNEQDIDAFLEAI